MVPVREHPPGRVARWWGELVFPHPFDRMAIRDPPHYIRAHRCTAPAKSGNRHSPRCLYLGWHCDRRSCRIVLAAASQEDFEDLVDDEQGNGQTYAEQPLVAAERCQAQASLQEAQLSRQEDEQQGHAVEYHLVSIVQDIPVERGQGLTVAAETVDDNEE